MRHIQRTRFVARAVVVLAAAAGLSACDVMVNTMHGGGREQAQQTWTRTYTLAAADAAVEIVNVSGTFDVEAVDGTSLEIKAVLTARGATEETRRRPWPRWRWSSRPMPPGSASRPSTRANSAGKASKSTTRSERRAQPGSLSRT